jgi:hypothetical protein
MRFVFAELLSVAIVVLAVAWVIQYVALPLVRQLLARRKVR